MGNGTTSRVYDEIGQFEVSQVVKHGGDLPHNAASLSGFGHSM